MIRLKHVTKRFAGSFAPALCDISVDIPAGEICAVIGSNGSGKSTLLKAISMDGFIDSGSVETGGKRIATVVQSIEKGTISGMSVLENISLCIPSKKLFYGGNRRYIMDLLCTLGAGLESKIDSEMASLSGGQRQMIATLMAFACDPDIILLDEHTAALDPKMQDVLMQYTVLNAKKNGTTVVMVTHKLSDAAKYSDRILMMSKGKIALDSCEKFSSENLLKIFHQYEDMEIAGDIT